MNQWGGDTVSGGSLEPHCLRKVFTCIHHAGARRTQAPRGPLGEAGPSAPQMVTPGPSLGLSVDLYSVGFFLFTDTKSGEAHPRRKPGQTRQPPLPQKQRWLFSLWRESQPGGQAQGGLAPAS